MRNSSLLKWTQGSKNNKFTGSSRGKDGKGGNERNWIHNPETLKKGHVAYLVKFLGSTEVDKPKGIDVVKQGIQKLKFNQQLKKSEGTKTPKVELTISIEGVAIQDPKSKTILHQYPLHRISYCADDKAEKRFFSFISKEEESSKHICYVFVSDKLAEEITLTIGQAFELAYKKFLGSNGKDLEAKKQLMTLQKRVKILENENAELKARLKEVANLQGEQKCKEYMAKNNLMDICQINGTVLESIEESGAETQDNTNKRREDETNTEIKEDEGQLINLDTNDGKLDGFTLDDLNDEDFNPRASSEEEECDFNPRDKFSANSTNNKLNHSTSSSVFPAPTIPPPDFKSPSFTHTQSFPTLNNNNKFHPGPQRSQNSSPFPNNPFTPNGTGGADLFGMVSFNATPSNTAVHQLSLDELDPFKQ